MSDECGLVQSPLFCHFQVLSGTPFKALPPWLSTLGLASALVRIGLDRLWIGVDGMVAPAQRQIRIFMHHGALQGANALQPLLLQCPRRAPLAIRGPSAGLQLPFWGNWPLEEQRVGGSFGRYSALPATRATGRFTNYRQNTRMVVQTVSLSLMQLNSMDLAQ